MLRRQPYPIHDVVELWRFHAAGLTNGVLLRTEVDHVTGQLSDTRTRFLGTRPPKVGATGGLLANF